MKPASPSRICLVGTFDQQMLSFPLQRGANILGSLPECDLYLQHPGISRQHARIEVRDRSVTLTDLDSKNGTHLNGRPIRSVELHLGDTLDLCGLSLTVARLDPDEAHLGLALSGPSPRAVDPSSKTTQLNHGSGSQGLEVLACLDWVGTIWKRLFRLPEADLEGSLKRLVEACGSDGAAIVEVQAVETVLLASHGAIDRQRLDDLLEGESDEAGSVTWAWEDLADGHRLGVAVFGGPLGTVRQALMQLVSRWVAAGRLPFSSVSPKEGHEALGRDLVFPPGYVRGESPAMATVYSQMRHLTQGDVPVLIIGDTGVGKELLARALHLSSHRREQPMVAINCAAIPGELLEAELFGIARGVATGVSARPGRILQADGGTLFLDEIGDMPAGLQAKLLRVLQEKEVQPLGGQPVSVDVRIVSATHNELLALIDDGVFRRDLYYRLAGYVLRLPSLAERSEDIPLLVDHFLRRFSVEIGKPIRGVTVGALRQLCTYSWPGNVRQLEHEVRRMAYLAYPGQAIDSSQLSPEIEGRPSGVSSANAGHHGEPRLANGYSPEDSPSSTTLGLPTLDLASLEKMAIETALEQCDGVLTDAGIRLGISRDALRRRIQRYGLRKDS